MTKRGRTRARALPGLLLIAYVFGEPSFALGQDPSVDTADSFFAVLVSDVDAAAAWYTRVLEAEEVRRVEGPTYEIRILRSDHVIVELIREAGAGAGAGRRAGLFKAGFFVDDLFAFHARVLALGADADAEPFVDDALGARSFVMRDPDGNRIQIFERCGRAC